MSNQKSKVLHPFNQEHKSQYAPALKAPTARKSLGKHGIHSKVSHLITLLSSVNTKGSSFISWFTAPPTKRDRKRETRTKTFKPLRNLQDHLWTDEWEKTENLQIQILFWLRWFTHNRLNSTTDTAWASDHRRVMHLNCFRYDTAHIM